MSRVDAHGPAAHVRTLSGRHVLYGFIGFFAIIFAADSFMIYKAVTTFGGLETNDAYRKGLAYNARIAVAQAQAKRGWHDRLDYVPGTERLRLSLVDRDGAGVSGLAVSAQLGRPATDQFDRTIALSQTGPGVYEAQVPSIEAGWWRVQITAQRQTEGEVLYQARRRLWIKP